MCKPRAVLSLPSGSSVTLEPEGLACPTPAPFSSRSRLPEIFTFEPESVAAPEPRRRRSRTVGRKPRRVLYPAGAARKHPPPTEGSTARRWLIYLCLVILAQICTEEPEQALPVPSDSALLPAREESGLQQLKKPEKISVPVWQNLTCYYPEAAVLSTASFLM